MVLTNMLSSGAEPSHKSAGLGEKLDGTADRTKQLEEADGIGPRLHEKGWH